MTTIQSSTSSKNVSGFDHLRLVGALAGKDIVDALKTKATLSTILIALLMVLFYRYFPALVEGSETLNVLLYAETESSIVTALERSAALAVYRYDSQARLMDVFVGAESVELAVVVPETAVAPNQPIVVDGYLMYWVDAAQRAEIKSLVEDELAAQLGQFVTLNLTGHDVYFNADNFFFVFSSTLSLLFVILMIGISIIPNLMIEEKQAKTLDVLLVSPASAGHVVVGKALAGLFYGVLGSAVVFAIFGYLIIQWPLAIGTAVLCTLFMVAIGLLLGTYAGARSQLQLLAWFLVIPLLTPVVLVALEGLVPDGAIAVMNWIPTVLVAQMFRLSLTPNAAFHHYGAALGVLLATILLLLALEVWLVRRQDQG